MFLEFNLAKNTLFPHVPPWTEEREGLGGFQPKYFHPLLQKQKDHVNTVPGETLPRNIADSLCPKSSRLAHLYGLPRTDKANLSMWLILYGTGTYN